MPPDYLHHHKDFPDLLRIVAEEKEILPSLIEKDYWIMHVLHGLQQQKFDFELKGGTSLSKGYKLIDRFSEDIDIYIHPPATPEVNENPKSTKAAAIASRKNYYDWLEDNIKVNGILSTERDIEFDDIPHYRSGGIRLHYKTHTDKNTDLKEGILLEAGFDTVTPNEKITISSWAYDKAIITLSPANLIDNRAIDTKCYHPGYTLVEKLQTIVKKFRKEQEDGTRKPNYIRQYYDVFCLLGDPKVQAFIGTKEYHEHKEERFRGKDAETPINENQAFMLSDASIRSSIIERYKATKGLYYNGQPSFEEILERISRYLNKL